MRAAPIRGLSENVRFFNKVEPVTESGCWLWTAATQQGYGRFGTDDRKTVLAHRYSWAVVHGSIPHGMHVCHKCDTPACVNPDHLFLGSDKDNIEDMYRKGRGNNAARGPKGTRSSFAKISEATVLDIYATRGIESMDKTAKRLGVSRSTVAHIRSGRQWSTVTGAVHYRERSSFQQ